MKKVKGKLEFLDKDGSVVKTRNKNMGEVPEDSAERIFGEAMKKLIKKHQHDALSRMNMCDVIEQTKTKVVLLIKMVLNFEYDQRITYQLV